MYVFLILEQVKNFVSIIQSIFHIIDCTICVRARAGSMHIVNARRMT